MDEPFEAIIIEPAEEDLALLESMAASPAFSITSIVTGAGGPPASWAQARGVERVDDLASVSRLLPGTVAVYLGRGLPPRDVVEGAASYGLSVMSREVFTRLTALKPANTTGAPRGFVSRYRKLLEDYFPTSRSSSTAVKLAACLTEATMLWQASGGVILVGSRGEGTLSLAAQRGLDLPCDTSIKIDRSGPVGRCFTRDKHEILDLTGEEGELLPGIRAASAACLAVKPGNTSRGVLVLWSDSAGAFDREDLAPLSLFAYYVATLLEVDDLGEKLGENLTTDPLTGLHNRRQFDRRLEHELQRAKRYTLNLSLCVFDIDDLSGYNGACGQMLGNLALSDIATIMLKGTRDVDFIARTGGDEFAVILPETNRLGALRVADRLRSEVATYPFPLPEDGASASLTLSAGISNFPSVKGSSQELLEKAYRALDAARSEGTDTIKLWDEKLEEEPAS